MKIITVVGNNGETLKCRISSTEEFSDLLSYFQALSLKDDEGALVFGFPSLENGRTYTPQQARGGLVAPYPPSTPENKSPSTPSSMTDLPASPPRNGIFSAEFVLAREDLVSRIMARARKIAIIRSPPATGKTSLLDLIEKSLRERDNTSVVRVRCRGDHGLLQELEGHLGVTLSVGADVDTLHGETWILIDDAQLNFDDEKLWKVVIKDLENMESNRIRIIIAATYDLASQGTTPYHFAEYPHFSNLILTTQEAESLYDGLIKRIFFAEGWLGFKDTLLRLAGGHVGVLSGGISMIHRLYVDGGKKIEESDALNALRDHRFRVNLNRCFPSQELMQDDQREAVGRTIVSGPQSLDINASQGSSDPPALVQLVRAGILSSNGSFSCLVAQWQYFNFFFSRPSETPDSIEDLVLVAVRSMSALRLRQSCDGDNFPKEAAFQQLFNEAFTMQLPPHVAVCPELNTFAENAAGETVTGELDFFISGRLDWAIEVLRNGDKINEHVQRFDPVNGKYRSVGHKAHLVVDCRGPRTKSAETIYDRCTLYFARDFTEVECKMREQPLVTLSLKE
eukprot:CAMPEP_0113462804 /NCGR_PEP_ID=MMETSP0014_2-20120614/12302_1 /TAXON_ID=2857 /ORGANISM="Nitzschia sp." /LENGTH=566 /DNA_ID=CAMNT_0000354721 /DNA_START=90 /DNA_END=1790 /DNA_ORIENTATION=+ /assembly_acc=CAM_ASM_000159